MTREEGMLLMTYLGRAGPIVHVTMVEAAALQPVLQAVAGVAFGTLTCAFAPVGAPTAQTNCSPLEGEQDRRSRSEGGKA